MATVRIPTPLRKYTEGKDEVAISGASIRELLDNLDGAYAGIGERIRDGKGDVRRFVNIFVADEDIRFLDGLDTKVEDTDEISIIPAIAGG